MDMQLMVSLAAGVPGSSPAFTLRRTSGIHSSATRERMAMAGFAAWIDGLGDIRRADASTRLCVLNGIRAIANAVDLKACVAPADRYGRRVLMEYPSSWTLAAITLRDGQETEAHDHAGWGCVLTVQGIERDRRYRLDETGEMMLIRELDYPVGAGYVFDRTDIHQPAGADPDRLTIALHFLVHDEGEGQRRHEHHGMLN